MVDKFSKSSKSVKSGRKSLSGRKNVGKTKTLSAKTTEKSGKSVKTKVMTTMTKSVGGKSGKMKAKMNVSKSGGPSKSLKRIGKSITGKSAGAKASAIQPKVPVSIKSKATPTRETSDSPRRKALLPLPEGVKEAALVNPVASTVGSGFFGTPGEDDLKEEVSTFKLPMTIMEKRQKLLAQQNSPEPAPPPVPPSPSPKTAVGATSKENIVKVDSHFSFIITKLPKSSTEPPSSVGPPESLSQFRIPSSTPTDTKTSESLESLDTGNSLSSDASSSINTAVRSQLKNGK